jgi:hypothetical protein
MPRIDVSDMGPPTTKHSYQDARHNRQTAGRAPEAKA